MTEKDLAAVQNKIKELSSIAETLPCTVIIHRIPDFKVLYVSERGLKQLNQKWEEVVGLSSEEYHARYFNEEDSKDYVPKIFNLIQRNTDEEVTFFQQVRTSKEREWDWYMSAVRIFARNDKGEPIACITTALKVDPDHFFTTKAVRLLEENSFIRKNYKKFSNLTERETEVLKLIALGKSTSEIAAELFISIDTAQTHRRNMRKKLKAENNFDIAMYARAFDLL
ncbi:MAG: response regulator transcription factor [Candidatus Cyclobacteriaceae bacterium M2_1C_046]